MTATASSDETSLIARILRLISGSEVMAWWFNPRTGAATAIGRYSNFSTREFTPPEPHGRPNDWVLVLDDADRGFNAPGYRVEDAMKQRR